MRLECDRRAPEGTEMRSTDKQEGKEECDAPYYAESYHGPNDPIKDDC
jgi:hypothetical protein